jgi:hypothetical protein
MIIEWLPGPTGRLPVVTTIKDKAPLGIVPHETGATHVVS